jgi:hypothetical protein
MLTDLNSNLASFRKPFKTDSLAKSEKPAPKPMASTPAKPVIDVNKTAVNTPIDYSSNLDSVQTIVESNLTVPDINIVKTDLVIARTAANLKKLIGSDIDYKIPTIQITTNPTGNIRTKVLSINKLIQNVAFTTPILQNNQSVIKFTTPILQNNQSVIKFTTPVLQNNQSVIAIRTPKLVNTTSPTNNIAIKDITITKFDQKKLEIGYIKQSPNIFISKFDTEKLETYSGTSIFTSTFVDKSKYNLDKAIIYTQATKFTNTKVNTSKYNIDNLPSKFSPGKYTPTKLYPENILLKSETLLNKPNSTRWKGNIPPAVNFILDTAAKGFTVKYDSSKFVGINGTTYTYPIKGKSVLQVGNYSLNNQLGSGSPKVKSLGFTSTKRYEDSVKSNAQQSILGTWAVTRKSPSPIDNQYTKFDLQREAWNPTYMKQPYVTRGIQNGVEPQRWGFGAGFDDGLVRGGAVTAAERILYDTIRLGKFAASPKGLLWIVKQVGLGLTRPNGLNRIQTGVKSLLSLAGGSTGLRFPAHGAVSIIKYEDAVLGIGDVLPELGDRLPKLKAKLFNGSLIIDNSWGGPNSLYGIGTTKISRVVDTKQNAITVAKQSYKIFGTVNGRSVPVKQLNEADRFPKYNIGYKYLSGFIPSLVNNTKNPEFETRGTVNQVDDALGSLKGKMKSFQDPGYATTSDWINAPGNGSSADVAQWNTTSYGQIPKKSKRKSNVALDFRKLREGIDPNSTNAQFQNTLETKYGFGSLDSAKTTVPQKGTGSFITSLADLRNNKHALANNSNFTGDKINAIDIGTAGDIYSDNAKDLIDFYFMGAQKSELNKNEVIVFRATLTGFTDDFSPGWNNINIMGRPDGSYIYTSFERTISFTFRVAALSRSEMIPIWRKLNYLATYTMPDFSTARASGPMMRLTIGNLFQKTPGFLNSFSISIPDDATWDIAEDADDNNLAKQLPTVVDVSVGYTVISDYRPQLHGRAYSLSKGGANNTDLDGNWLFDSMDKVKVRKPSKDTQSKTGE